MRQPLQLLAVFLALLLAPLANAAEPKSGIFDSAERDREVVAERNAREQLRRACADNATEARERIYDGTADAKQMAEDAARRGCFGLMTTKNAIPFGIWYALGVECRPNGRLFAYGRLRAFGAALASDVVSIPRDEETELRKRQRRANFSRFAREYNTAIVANANFPYRDFCRLAGSDYRPQGFVDLDVSDWGFRPLEETDEPSDIYEAARRGTLRSLQELIESDPLDIHLPDVLGLTPLAWAVIYDRPDHMRLLLANGAHPYGEPFWDRPQEFSPFTIARTQRRRDLTAILRTGLAARNLSPPGLPALLDEQHSHMVDTAGRRFELEVSPTGRVTDCRLVVGDGWFEYPSICEHIRESLVYFPAEDGIGDPVADTVIYRVLAPSP